MNVRLKEDLLIVSSESLDERLSLRRWADSMDGCVFRLWFQDDRTIRLTSLGLQPIACREPIAISFRSTAPDIQLISNLAYTPFLLNEEQYASIEAFWQGLKFDSSSRRREIAGLHGQAAKQAGLDAPKGMTILYNGQSVRVGTYDHWKLMAAACWAKFNQHGASQQALLKTGNRPLLHRTRRDSRNIPGVIMADIWMRIRRRLSKHAVIAPLAGEKEDGSCRESKTPQRLPEVRTKEYPLEG